jgi:putative copper export protein
VTGEIGYEWLPKAVVYVTAQLAVGLAVARWLARPADGAADVALDARLARAAIAVAVLALVALAARAWVHTATAFGWAEAWVGENLRVIALESRWGERWQMQAAAAGLLAVAAVATVRARAAWLVFALSALAFSAALPLLGHAAGSPWRHVVHAAHLIGSGLWLGTLGVITTLAIGRARSASPDASAGGLVARFSPLALTAAMVVFATGVVAAVLYVGALDALWTTPYGRMLLVKLALVGAIAACGWRNWQRVRHELPPERAVMTLEWACALAAVTVTAVLSETEHP